MRTRKISNYLDTGSMALFARQIADILGGVRSVAIHDAAGQLVWAGPNAMASDDWQVSPFLRERLPGPGFCERLSNHNLVYVFYLGDDQDDGPEGTVSIQLDPSNPPSFEFAHAEIEPIIGCIQRQLVINAELSSVRRMTEDGQKGLQLLVKLDELDTSGGPEKLLGTILELAARHFNVELAAVVLPHIGVQQTVPSRLLNDAATAKAIMTTLGSLITTAKMHRKVLLSDANISTKVVAGLSNRRPKVLCCPIINSRDDVIGIFVLMGPANFTRDQVRLARAICTKIRAFTRTADELSQEHYSRHGLLRYIDSVLQRDTGATHALLYVDVDQLHVVNDKFGHVAGDHVIRQVGTVIAELANKGDAISHLSGDRFGLFLRDSNETNASQTAELILDTLHGTTVEHENTGIEIAASIGIVLMPSVATDASTALNTAEIAARSAKDRGGNRSVVFRDVDASVVQRRSDLDQVNHLQYALMNNRLLLHAQPIVSLGDEGRSNRYEILVRMLGNDDETLPPAKFMSSAERYQMMSAIDRWVIKSTLDQLAGADNMLEVNLASFSINISAQSLVENDFHEYIETQISESGISPDALCFEITETAAVRNLERAQRFIRRLRKLGCRLALDDFGTGYCSFAYLKDLPVHYVKIDGVFVRDVLENPLSEAIISSITQIAKVMNAATVAEHVENDLILQRMRAYGIDFAQGFAIGKPTALDAVLRSIGPPRMLEITAPQDIGGRAAQS
ncbi:MAG: EAL domain-containing protein [Gammaproteobacteria bacterium]|nr:EAL domain-containing protein [Gammaproteobacteria bacterium]